MTQIIQSLNVDGALEKLHEFLESFTGCKLKLRINDNRSTMLSIQWERESAKISLHRMFLKAPQNIIQELASYIKSGRDKALPLPVKMFIEDQTQKIDYSYSVKKDKLITRGEFFDLETVYASINTEYFNDQLKLAITWYGNPGRRLRSQVNFGLYSYPLKLIKIHKLLDRFDTPECVLKFVVYHEMLHSVCMPFVNKRGRTVIHTPEFRRREKEFRFFQEATAWFQTNKNRFFT